MNLFLPAASSFAFESDALMLALMAVSAAVMALVFGLMLTYVVRYRADSGVHRGRLAEKSWYFELGWTSATLVIFFGLFLWAAHLYVRLWQPPADAIKVYVTGKQWMWKAEHAGGQKEINALHVPLGRPVQLVMTSEDVIHDFSVPAFRVKHDVLPGRYTSLWFKAGQPGDFRLFCTQFCGTDHAAMLGWITVLAAPAFEDWLARAGTDMTLADRGRGLFQRFGCGGCHRADRAGGAGTVRAPSLDGLYGSPVPLADGTVVSADDQYLRNAILNPRDQVVAGYEPVMPSFAGQIGEGDLMAVIAYIRSLTGAP